MSSLMLENVEKLRAVSNSLENDLLSQFKFELFPGWDVEFDNEQGKLVREAARVILADNLSPDEGSYISHKALAALIHYVADTLESKFV